MSVCEYPNNVGYFKEKCPGEEKYNMCYGEDTKFSTLEKLEEHVSKIQKDANHYEKMKDIFTLGCWENKNNSPKHQKGNKFGITLTSYLRINMKKVDKKGNIQ